MNFKVDILNADAVISRIKKLEGYKPLINQCVVKSLADMKNRSTALTPKRSGELLNSAYGNTIGELEGEFGYSAYYAPFVEYGHRIVYYGRELGFKEAEPFLAPNALEQQSIFAADCNNVIARLAR